jgi:glyoxylase-like metal-dependent hydrolase (beta-lactamase superfamily II)
MRATTVTEDITQLTRLRFVNAYLVREDDGFTLVDTTTGGAAKSLIAAARTAGGDIRRIALTHGHGDHVGSLDALKDALGETLEVLMPELDARIHAGESVTDQKPSGSWPKLATTPDVRLKAGDRVASLEVLASPGHSPGHVSFLDTRDGTLIAGDAFTSYGKVAIPVFYYPRFPFAAMATWDKDQTLDSARTLRRLDPSTLLVGHGPPVRAPGPAIDAALARASR